MHLTRLTLVVRDYDEAAEWYARCLGWGVLEDVDEGRKRWVVIGPGGAGEVSFVLGRASDADQRAAVGRQCGGRVAFFLATDDFAGDEARLRREGVAIVREPRDMPYGRVLVFEDLYGNRWDLIGG